MAKYKICDKILHQMNQTRLNNIIHSFPQTPGVYLFNDNKNNALYIGKASRLKDRLLSYLKTTDIRLKKMIGQSHSLKRRTTDSEIEALMLESQLIKKLKPRFNIVMRDDKQYFYVGFTKEKFPHIFVGHQPNKTSLFIGPFTDGTALKISLRFLRNIFPYCTCKQKHNIPCLNYHIGKCPGFCCLKDGPEWPVPRRIEGRQRIARINEYQKNIKAIKNILSGKKTSLIKKLKSEMKKYAEKKQFTKAIDLRNKIEKLERVFENARIIANIQTPNPTARIDKTLINLTKILKLKIPLNRIEGYDISNIQGTHAVGSMVVFSVKGENFGPDKNEYRKFKINSKSTPDDTAMLSEMLQRRFHHPEWRFPDLILIDGGKGQLNAAIKILADNHSLIPVIAITKNKKHLGHKITIPSQEISLSRLPPQVRNLLLQIDGEAHRFAISYHRRLRNNIFK